MRICCGVTLYFPKVEDIKNILYYAESFEKIYVYNNTDAWSSEIKNIENNQRIEIIATGSNDGLGVALDVLCATAKQSGYDYIMLYDQDSRMSNEDIRRMIQVVKKNERKAMIYCPTVVYGKSGILPSGLCEKLEKVEWCITSGSMLDLSVYEEKILFDRKYFIDRIDKDICKQVMDLGGVIYRVNNVFLYQELGQEYKMGYGLHAALRHYYIARNRLYYNSKYQITMMISIMQTVKHLLLIAIFEDNKKSKFDMVVKGIQDYIKKKMGRKEDMFSDKRD